MSEQESKERPDGAGGEQPILTNRQGHPVYDNQNTRTVGERGPTVLENYQFLEKITHFDRERIPERVVHARGAGAHGYFEAYGTIGAEPADGQMTYHVDGVEAGENPHVNYEPSSRGGLREAPKAGADHTPYVEGPVVRQKISRTNDYKQAGERYRTMEDAERDDLVANLVGALKQCNPDIQVRMIGHLTQCDPEYGGRVADGLGLKADVAAAELA